MRRAPELCSVSTCRHKYLSCWAVSFSLRRVSAHQFVYDNREIMYCAFSARDLWLSFGMRSKRSSARTYSECMRASGPLHQLE